jgi:ferric-dicitrate binding protein FerR (iron transport regulator)
MKRKAIYKQLIRRYVEDKASDKEKEVFFHLLANGKLDKYLHSEMEARAVQLLAGTAQTPTPARRRPISAIIRYMAAAAVLGVLAVAALLWRGHRPPASGNDTTTAPTYYKNEVPPGGSHAILTLANGSQLVLDSTKKGLLAMQGAARLTKVSAGCLSYQATAGNSSAVYYNTITTPAGGQYQLALADGTKVWLNALSTFKYPTSFNGTDRTVELTGEAYFEVAKNKNKSFHVLVNGMDVQVLGTSFNINAYADESALRTTLLEGAVRLVKGNNVLALVPGQQGLTTVAGGLSLVPDANVGEALAWKNGYFSFDDADIRTVMRQLARWYGIRIKYEGSPTRSLFWGKMGRDLNLTQVLAGLDKSKVHFQLDGTTLTVLP